MVPYERDFTEFWSDCMKQFLDLNFCRFSHIVEEHSNKLTDFRAVDGNISWIRHARGVM